MHPRFSPRNGGALIAEVQTAETARQDCADRLAEPLKRRSATADRDARAALEAASAAREEFARAEERFESSQTSA